MKQQGKTKKINKSHKSKDEPAQIVPPNYFDNILSEDFLKPMIEQHALGDLSRKKIKVGIIKWVGGHPIEKADALLLCSILKNAEP
ncbi:MAG: hypothetical protein J7502_13110 [Flavisolibacter sp.]|nr:hypothetical protein [Flavisolibacter sp.]